jgi:hypothetical protein
MNPEPLSGLSLDKSEDEAAILARYGIVRTPAHRYQVGDFRYSRLSDAVAQARRTEAAAARP